MPFSKTIRDHVPHLSAVHQISIRNVGNPASSLPASHTQPKIPKIQTRPQFNFRRTHYLSANPRGICCTSSSASILQSISVTMAPSNDKLLSPSAGRPSLRRFSSQTATEEQITSGQGPVVVVPDRMMVHRSQSHSSKQGFAESMETAKLKLDKLNLEENLLESPDSDSPDEPSSVSDLNIYRTQFTLLTLVASYTWRNANSGHIRICFRYRWSAHQRWTSYPRSH